MLNRLKVSLHANTLKLSLIIRCKNPDVVMDKNVVTCQQYCNVQLKVQLNTSDPDKVQLWWIKVKPSLIRAEFDMLRCKNNSSWRIGKVVL